MGLEGKGQNGGATCPTMAAPGLCMHRHLAVVLSKFAEGPL